MLIGRSLSWSQTLNYFQVQCLERLLHYRCTTEGAHKYIQDSDFYTWIQLVSREIKPPGCGKVFDSLCFHNRCVCQWLPENPEKLIYLRVTMKQRRFGCQFSKDGPCAPQVNGGGIPRRTQENLRGTVPQRHYLDNTSVGG